MTLAAWEPIYGVYALMGCFVASALCLLAWAVRSGAMKDDEAPKYRMLRDDERRFRLVLADRRLFELGLASFGRAWANLAGRLLGEHNRNCEERCEQRDRGAFHNG